MRNYSIKEYNEVLELRKKRLTFRKISKILGIPMSTIYMWTRGSLPMKHSKKHREHRIKNIKMINEKNRGSREEKYNNLKRKIDTNFAFVLGSVLGDGCISFTKRNGGQVTLITKDKDFALDFKKSLDEWSLMKSKLIYYRNVWQVWSYSTVIAKCLKYYNLSDIFRTDENIKCSFLRGIFDAEGSVDVKGKKIVFANTSTEITEITKILLEDIGIECKVYNRFSNTRYIEGRKLFPGTYFVIQIGSRENLKTYHEKVGFSINRKQERLDKIIKSYKPL
ncbi:MAG: LAGLIDADG family homing endonuclease [Candidatus Aenigmatarchaeota archaeon]